MFFWYKKIIESNYSKRKKKLTKKLITYVWKAVSRDFHGACIHRPTIYAHSHSSSQLIWQDSGDWAAQDSWPLPAKPKTDEHYIYIPFSVSPAARTIPLLKLHRKKEKMLCKIHLACATHTIFNFSWHQVNLFELTRCRLGQNGSVSGMQYRASFRSVLDKSEVIRPKSTSTKWVGMSHLTRKPFKCSSTLPLCVRMRAWFLSSPLPRLPRGHSVLETPFYIFSFSFTFYSFLPFVFHSGF